LPSQQRAVTISSKPVNELVSLSKEPGLASEVEKVTQPIRNEKCLNESSNKQ
jgi:hypothetical protein